MSDSNIDQRQRIMRGLQAADALRSDIIRAAAKELQERAFDLFVGADHGEKGDEQRGRATEMINGGEAFLAVLHEWVIEAKTLQNESEPEDV